MENGVENGLRDQGLSPYNGDVDLSAFDKKGCALLECSSCSSVMPLYDTGEVELRGQHAAEPAFRYESKEQLISYLTELERTAGANEPERGELRIRIRGVSGPYSAELPFMPLAQYLARLKQHHVFDIIREKAFTSHLQPIVSGDGRVYAYEFLLRPLPAGPGFKPYELFDYARAAGLHSFLDRQARISAIETSARLLPRGIKRFINFLPSSIYNPAYCLSHTFASIEANRLDPGDFVFEVVETEKVDDLDHLQNVFRVYQEHGVMVALDDVGAGFSTKGLAERLQPDYIKIDRAIIDGCDRDPAKQRTISEIVRIAESYGGTVLGEGIERPEEWAFCRDAGVSLGQGYWFGKPAEEPLS